LVRFFVTLSIKILRLFRLVVLFEADILKGDVNYCINHKVPIFYEQNPGCPIAGIQGAAAPELLASMGGQGVNLFVE
jgi:hypothetical protein